MDFLRRPSEALIQSPGPVCRYPDLGVSENINDCITGTILTNYHIKMNFHVWTYFWFITEV